MQIKSVYLMLGGKCNFKCAYCMQQETFSLQEDSSINPLTIDFINKLTPLTNDKILFQFWGGEPLLYFPLIQRIVPLLDSNKFQFAIISNGSLLTQKIVNYLNNYNFAFALSHDGELTKYTRGTNILENPEKLKLFKEIQQKGISAVLSANNYKINEMWDYFDRVFGEYVCINHDWILKTWDMPKHLYEFNLLEFEQYFSSLCNDILNKIRLNKFSLHEATFLKPYAQKIDIYNQCNTNFIKTKCGTTETMLNIDVTGNVYKCHNCSDPLGNITQNNYYDIQNCFEYKTHQKCYNCESHILCRGGCILVPNREDYYCKLYKIISRTILPLMSNIVEIGKKEEIT